MLNAVIKNRPNPMRCREECAEQYDQRGGTRDDSAGNLEHAEFAQRQSALGGLFVGHRVDRCDLRAPGPPEHREKPVRMALAGSVRMLPAFAGQVAQEYEETQANHAKPGNRPQPRVELFRDNVARGVQRHRAQQIDTRGV